MHYESSKFFFLALAPRPTTCETLTGTMSHLRRALWGRKSATNCFNVFAWCRQALIWIQAYQRFFEYCFSPACMCSSLPWCLQADKFWQWCLLFLAGEVSFIWDLFFHFWNIVRLNVWVRVSSHLSLHATHCRCWNALEAITYRSSILPKS